MKRTVFASVVVAAITILVASVVIAQRTPGGYEPPNETALRNEKMGMVNQVSGRVTDEEGNPISKARVIARFKMHQTGAQGEGYTFTNANGEFQLRGLGKDQFLIYLEAAELGYLATNEVEVDLTKGSKLEPVLIKGQLGPEVTVEVIDPEAKKPVEGIRVTVEDPLFMRARFNLITGANGQAKCRMPALKISAHIDLESTHGRYSPAPWHHRYEDKELKSPEPIKFTFHVYNEQSKDRSFEFSGKLVNAQGEPVSNGAIEVVQSQTDIHRGKSKSDGTFSFRIPRMWNRDPQHSGYTVKVSKGQLMSSKFITETEFWSPVTLTLEDKQAQYSGSVVDSGGNPIANCQVIAYDYYAGQTSSTGGQSKLTDSKGRFTFDRLVPGGSIHFRIGDAGGNVPTGMVRYPKMGVQMIEPGNHDLGQITVPKAGKPITGTIAGINKELKKGTVTLVIIGEHCYAHVQVDDKWNFASQPVPDEPLTLYVFTGENGGFRTDPNGPDLLLKRSVTSGERVELKVKWRAPAP